MSPLHDPIDFWLLKLNNAFMELPFQPSSEKYGEGLRLSDRLIFSLSVCVRVFN